MSYYFTKETTLGYEQALIRVQEELQKEGFGIITEIDVRETLKKKVDVDFRKYRILGACNMITRGACVQACGQKCPLVPVGGR
jgi:uncharacterized protein (DUF302 family)